MHIILIDAPRASEKIPSKNTFRMTKKEKCMSESHTFNFWNTPKNSWKRYKKYNLVRTNQIAEFYGFQT